MLCNRNIALKGFPPRGPQGKDGRNRFLPSLVYVIPAQRTTTTLAFIGVPSVSILTR